MVGTTGGLGLRTVRAMGRRPLGVVGKSEPPPLAQVVGIDESLRRRDPVPTVERREERSTAAPSPSCAWAMLQRLSPRRTA